MAWLLPWRWFRKPEEAAQLPAMKRRSLVLDRDKCIGCEACTNVCPAGLITLADEGPQRTLRLATECKEACTRCADACSERAIALTPAPRARAAQKYQTAAFDLLPCQGCGAFFTSRRLAEKLLVAVPKELGATRKELGWLGLCPGCRQISEAGELLLTRSGGHSSGVPSI